MADEAKVAQVTIAEPPATADVQDPLPESGFLYRRITTWVVSLVVLAALWYIVVALRALEAPDGLVTVAKWLIGLLALIQTYYLIAPSAEHIVKLFQQVSAWKAGVVTRSVASVTGRGGQAISSTTAGKPEEAEQAEETDAAPSSRR